MSLIITTKWKPHIHGWEYEENHLIPYMKQKYLDLDYLGVEYLNFLIILVLKNKKLNLTKNIV